MQYPIQTARLLACLAMSLAINPPTIGSVKDLTPGLTWLRYAICVRCPTKARTPHQVS